MLTLRPYQIEGRDFLASRRFALLADQMRVGKTPQAILAAHAVDAKRIAVVCPAIAVPQWHEEFKRWWPGEILPPLHIMSYDRARMTNWVIQPRVDVAIIDECQFAKNPNALRTKSIYGKSGIGWRANRMWALSGTPVTKHAGELWPMLFAWGVIKIPYEQFCRAYCTYDWTKTKITGTRVEKIPELKALYSHLTLRRTRKQVRPEMDEIDFQFLAIESGKDLASELENDPSRKEVAIAKAPALVEEIVGCLERSDYKQTVVFGWHRDAIDAVVQGLNARNIFAEALVGGMPDAKRERTQAWFAKGTLQVLVAQIIAAGTAIDLSAASHGYFLELSWLPSENIQAANRLVSLQKDEPVTFDICTWPGSVDDKVQRILLRRAQETRTILTSGE